MREFLVEVLMLHHWLLGGLQLRGAQRVVRGWLERMGGEA